MILTDLILSSILTAVHYMHNHQQNFLIKLSEITWKSTVMAHGKCTPPKKKLQLFYLFSLHVLKSVKANKQSLNSARDPRPTLGLLCLRKSSRDLGSILLLSPYFKAFFLHAFLKPFQMPETSSPQERESERNKESQSAWISFKESKRDLYIAFWIPMPWQEVGHMFPSSFKQDWEI